MKTVMFAAVGGCALLLAACSSELQQAQSQPAPTAGTQFTQALSAYYRQAAQAQWTGHTDFAGSEHLAGKSLAAAKGEAVAPDTVEGRGPPVRLTSDLVDSRNRLMAAMDRNATTLMPETTARAQVAYDCWLEEASDPVQAVESKWLENKVRNCRDDFNQAMAMVDAATLPPRPVPDFVRSQKYMIFFDSGSAKITTEGQKALQAAANYARQDHVLRVTIVGHTDRTGSSERNQDLSLRRAETVQAFLTHQGVPEALIKTEARGEGDAQVATAEGVAEPQNRNVDVTVDLK